MWGRKGWGESEKRKRAAVREWNGWATTGIEGGDGRGMECKCMHRKMS